MERTTADKICQKFPLPSPTEGILLFRNTWQWQAKGNAEWRINLYPDPVSQKTIMDRVELEDVPMKVDST